MLISRADIVARAQVHVGHREVANNRSPLIDSWLARCGLEPGLAWCAAFASWCIERREWPKSPIDSLMVAEAGALRLASLFELTVSPQPGDLMFFPTNNRGNGHVGIVVAGNVSEVLCIEGNSSNAVRYVARLRSEVRFASTRSEVLALPSYAGIQHVQFDGTR